MDSSKAGPAQRETVAVERREETGTTALPAGFSVEVSRKSCTVVEGDGWEDAVSSLQRLACFRDGEDVVFCGRLVGLTGTRGSESTSDRLYALV